MSKIEVNTVEPQCGTNLTIGASGDTITFPSGTTVVNNGSQTGFGRSGTVDWQTGSIKTSTFTAVNGEGYFVNTTGGAVTANLPAGSAGAIVSFSDYTRTFATNTFTISPNGSEKIGGVAQNLPLSVNGQAITLVYVDATEGWINVQNAEDTETGLVPAFVSASGGNTTITDGDFKIHTFTGPGTFTVSCAGNSGGSNTVSYMVVAGGGGGGSGDGGGGGAGAGGFRESKASSDTYTASPLNATSGPFYNLPVSAQGYPIVVGSGGTGAGGTVPNPPAGTQGGTSSFSTISAAGGGAGGNFPASSTPDKNGRSGGSGGGGTTDCSTGGTGNSPPVSPAQGTNGGGGAGNAGGGGGGAGAVGETSPAPSQAGAGGTGVGTAIHPNSPSPVGTPGPSGSLRYFAGGGGGNNEAPGSAPAQGAGGTGGGAAGDAPGNAGNAGTNNTGGGGGGIDSSPSHPSATHNGGSGIVMIRYKFQ